MVRALSPTGLPHDCGSAKPKDAPTRRPLELIAKIGLFSNSTPRLAPTRALGLRVFAMPDGERLFRRQHQALAGVEKEVADRQRVPERNAEHPCSIKWIGELEADRHERNDDGDRGAGDAQGLL